MHIAAALCVLQGGLQAQAAIRGLLAAGVVLSACTGHNLLLRSSLFLDASAS